MNEDAFLLSQWLERSVFEALEKQYLKTMEFSIFTKSKDGVKKEVENYSFDVTYPTDTSTSTTTSSSINANSQVYQVNKVPVTLEQTKSQAISFIRCLVEFSSTLDALPEDRWLTLRLKYFDHTPIDYEPLYFHSDTDKHIFEEDNVNSNRSKESGVVIKVAQLKTTDHHLALTYTGFETLMETPLSSQLQSKCQILRSDANPSNDDGEMKDGVDDGDTDIIMMSQSQSMNSSSIPTTTTTSPCATPHKNKKKNVCTSDSQQSMSMSPSTVATMNTTTSPSFSLSQREKCSIIKDPIHQKRKRARTTRERKQQKK